MPDTLIRMSLINTVYAQSTGNSNTVEGLAGWIARFVNDTLVYLIFALAFAFFLFGVFKYFFGSGKNAEENRREGGKFIFWSLIAFAVMISVWGIVNLLVNTLGFDRGTRPNLPCFEGDNCNRAPGSSGSATNILPSGYNTSPNPDPGLPPIY